MIEIHGLTKIYPGNVTALHNVDLQIGAGMFGLLGPNGAGKTTLMRIVAGLMGPTDGSVRVFGHDVEREKQTVKALLGYLPQELGLYPNLTAREFLDYVAILKGLTDGTARRRQVEDLLEAVRLTDAANRRLKTYSGGMKRRVGIAQALLGTPELLIVDEPTAGLDPEERVRFRNLLSEIARRCTVILSTHIIEDIGASCNALAVIGKGRVVFRGTPSDLVRKVRGKVWTIRAAQPITDSRLSVISTLQLADAIQYRVVGEGVPALYPGVSEAEPTLEDSYIWLMREQSQVPMPVLDAV